MCPPCVGLRPGENLRAPHTQGVDEPLGVPLHLPHHPSLPAAPSRSPPLRGREGGEGSGWGGRLGGWVGGWMDWWVEEGGWLRVGGGGWMDGWRHQYRSFRIVGLTGNLSKIFDLAQVIKIARKLGQGPRALNSACPKAPGSYREPWRMISERQRPLPIPSVH